MKAKIHIATKEYCFVEFETEVEGLSEIVEIHDNLALLIKDKEGLNATEWAKVRNRYAMNNEITPEEVEGCSKAQRYFINQMKLVFKSIKENNDAI